MGIIDDIIGIGTERYEKYKMIIRGIIQGYGKEDIVRMIHSIEKLDSLDIMAFSKLLKIRAAKDTGREIGFILGNKTNVIYHELPQNLKEYWENERWLHHGAIGDLIIKRAEINGNKKKDKDSIKECDKHMVNAFMLGLGEGLKDSDEPDMAKWFDKNYRVALSKLKKMK